MFKNWGKKRYYKRLITKIEESIYSMELRILTIKEIREGIRREFDRVSGVIKEIEERIEKEMQQPKQNQKKLETLMANKKEYEKDAEVMSNQMIGKWSEKEQGHIGGIDQEIKAIQQKINGGLEFKGLIQKELKKI